MLEVQSIDKAKEHWKCGNDLVKEEKIKQAIAEYRQATLLDKDNAKYHLSLGIAYTSIEDRRKAVACLRQALALAGDNQKDLVHVNYYLGLNLYRLRDYSGAEQALKISMRYDPDKLHIHYELGNVYNKTVRPQLARDEYWRALELSTNFPPIDIAHCYAGLGTALWLSGHVEAALNKFAEAHRLCPSLPGLRQQIFRVYLWEGKIVPALRALTGMWTA